MSHSACSRPRPSWTLWHRWGYWPLFAGFLPGYLRPLLWHCASSGGGEKKRITPGFGGNVSCKTTAQSTYEGTDQESCCVSLSSATSFVVLCVDSFPRPGPGVLSCFRLCGQWPVPVHPVMIRIWVGSDIHEPQAASLGRLFKTNQLLQLTCLQPPPQRAALLTTCQHVQSIYLQSGWSRSKGGHG